MTLAGAFALTDEDMPTHRICTKCGIDKPLTEFHRNAKGRYGRQSRCMSCARDHRVLWENNRELLAEKRAAEARAKAELLADGRKQCRRCIKVKSLEDFHRLKTSKDGYYSYCAECAREAVGATYEANPRSQHDSNLRKYNINSEHYDHLLYDVQGGKCAIPGCGNVPEDSPKRFHVDHDHACCDYGGSCGKCIRQILCSGCNVTLGFARDNAELLRGMADYLDRHRLATMLQMHGENWTCEEAEPLIGGQNVTQWIIDGLRRP